MKPLIVILAFALIPAQANAAPGTDFDNKLKTANKAWRDSCRNPNATGGCFKERTVRLTNSWRLRGVRTTLVARNSKGARAQKSLIRLVARYENDAALRKLSTLGPTVAEARFYLAEAHFEKLLKHATPRGLNFSPQSPKRAQRSIRRFTKFLSDWKAQAKQTNAAYEKIGSIGFYGLAATARTAAVARLFARMLYGFEIPADVRTGPYRDEAIDAFCDTLSDQADPLGRLAQEASAVCNRLQDDPVWTPYCRAQGVASASLSEPRSIRRVLRQGSTQAKLCYDMSRESNPDLAGTARATLQIAVDGSVASAKVEGLGDEVVESCIAKGLKEIHFPIPRPGDNTEVRHSIHLDRR